MNSLLQLQELTHCFGGLKAVSGLNLAVRAGGIHGLIGPNGSGKTTTFNLISGLHTPTLGRILFDGEPIVGRRPCHIVRGGIARTFQNLRIFQNLSVLDNVRIALRDEGRCGLLPTVLRLRGFLISEARVREKSMDLLHLMNLDLRAQEKAGELPYGDLRRLEIARALATRPRLLLLDEPAAGMNPREVVDLMGLVQRIRNELGVTVLLIEHHMKFVMGLCEEVLVMDFGETIAQGPPGDVVKDPRVLEAYLGRKEGLC